MGARSSENTAEKNTVAPAYAIRRARGPGRGRRHGDLGPADPCLSGAIACVELAAAKMSEMLPGWCAVEGTASTCRLPEDVRSLSGCELADAVRVAVAVTPTPAYSAYPNERSVVVNTNTT